MASSDLTPSRVRYLFDYNAESGVLTSRTTGRKRQKGAAVGTIRKTKYSSTSVVVSVDGRSYLAHRLIWLHVHGEWPKYQIDHINGDATDNRLSNLRDVTAQENSKNMKRPSSNSSGYTGVSWRESKNKWRSVITLGGKSIHLGYFDAPIDAIAARKSAELSFGFSDRHGR